MDSNMKYFLFLIELFIQMSIIIVYPIEDNHIQSEMDKIALSNIFGGKNPSKTLDGLKIIDGDIAIETNFIDTSNKMDGRKAISEDLFYWADGIIPYIFHPSTNKETKEAVFKAIEHWENETCIRFKQRKSENYYIRFRADTSGCWSLVGRQFLRFGWGQDVSLGKGCATWKVVAHELGHVIGFFHEQSRSDRDKAIHINWKNIRKGFDLQFDRQHDLNFSIDYDYSSLMQYPGWAFSKDVFSKNTIVTLDPRYQRFLGRYIGLTFRDKKAANALYSCNRACIKQKKSSCLNGGFIRDFTSPNGIDCRCECPPNTYGDFCQYILNPDYYESIWPLPCGSYLTEPGIIKTPNYPKRLSPKESCVWTIQSPEDKNIKITFKGFSFAPREMEEDATFKGKCVNESVEIRLEDEFDGNKYCGEEIELNTSMVSKGNKVIIIILADMNMIGKGLEAEIEFIDRQSMDIVTTSSSLWSLIFG